jgi:hypothetical protein
MKKNKAAVALGRRGGKAKNAKLTEEERKAVMAKARSARTKEEWDAILVKARANRWPPKIHTLKKPCGVEGCRVTVNHEHI